MTPPFVVAALPDEINPVVVTPDFTIGLEDQDGVTLVHCSVRRWGKDVARAARKAMDEVIEQHGGPLYAAARHPHGDDFVKLGKFCRWMGFKFWRVVHVNGEDHAVYVRWS